jgi:hypothetical protein
MRQTGDFGRYHLDRRKTPSPTPIGGVCFATGLWRTVGTAPFSIALAISRIALPLTNLNP